AKKQPSSGTPTPAKTQCVKLPPAAEISQLAKSFADATRAGHDVLADSAEAGTKLYRILVEPAKDLIAAGARVVVLPDGELNALNFETLIVPDPKPHFWLEDVTITTANSLSLLDKAANRPRAPQKSLLLVGDAVPVPDFPPLAQAKVEIQRVRGRFPSARTSVLQEAAAKP